MVAPVYTWPVTKTGQLLLGELLTLILSCGLVGSWPGIQKLFQVRRINEPASTDKVGSKLSSTNTTEGPPVDGRNMNLKLRGNFAGREPLR